MEFDFLKSDRLLIRKILCYEFKYDVFIEVVSYETRQIFLQLLNPKPISLRYSYSVADDYIFVSHC